MTSEEPFIGLTSLGSKLSEVRDVYGPESKSKPCDEAQIATSFVFHQNGYEINATFHDDVLERVFFVPNSDDGFTNEQLDLLAKFYGQGMNWIKIADTEYMVMFRRNDDLAYFIYNGIAQFKTSKFDNLKKATP